MHASQDETGAPAGMEAFEARLSRPLDLDRIHRRWDYAEAGEREVQTLAAGRIPVVSFNGVRTAGVVTWAEVASGAHDERLRQIGESYAALDARLFLLYHHLPDRDLAEFGTPGEYRAAYRRVVACFRQAGATRVAFVWGLRALSFATQADDLYPGDDVVDWIGTSAYNYGLEAEGSRWMSLQALLADFLAWAEPRGKPLLLTEWASVEDPADPSRKPQWLREARELIERHPAIRAAVYYHIDDDPLAADSSAATWEAFQALAAAPYFRALR